MTKRALLTSGLALCLLTLALPVRGTPRLVLEESEFDFGYVPQNSRISHIFWLKSAGDDSLKILRVVPGCGCTKAPLERSDLAAGDSTRLEIIFSTRRYSNRVSKSPRIETNEGPPHKNVRISANVVKRPDSTYPVIIKPYKLDISQFGETVRDEMSFDIINVSEQDVNLTLIDKPEGLFEVNLPGIISAGQIVQAGLKLNEEAIGISFEKSITIELNDEQTSRFTIPVKRNIRIAEGAIPAVKHGGK